MKYHQMPQACLEALSAGGSDQETLSVLVATQYSKHKLLLHGVVDAAIASGHPQANLAGRGYELLAQVERHDRETVAEILRHPSVGAWGYRTMAGLRGAMEMSGATPAVVATIAATAAIRAGFPAEIAVPVTSGVVTFPSLGAAGTFDGEMAVVRLDACGAEVSCGPRTVRIPVARQERALGWRPLVSLLEEPWPLGVPADRQGTRFRLLADDIDPFRMPAVPDAARNADLANWAETFRAAWRLLADSHPVVAAELAALVRVIVPLITPAEGQRSSSSPETFGAIALSRPLDPVLLAVSLTHEVQHVKLSALLDLVQMTKTDEGARFYAPWRDDPRPASGLLQGTYAYLGVTQFWGNQIAESSPPFALASGEFEFSRWRQAAALGAETLLSSGQLTAAGETFAQGIGATLAGLEQIPVSQSALARASTENALHRERWLAAHGSQFA